MLEIANQPVNPDTISARAIVNILDGQRFGAATKCVPVDVTIKGGTYYPTADRDYADVTGEFRFSIFFNEYGHLYERIFRYFIYVDGSLKRVKSYQVGEILADETNPIEYSIVHQSNRRVSLLKPKISWSVDSQTRGVDATIQEGTTLHFIALPEPGQWKESEIYPGADRVRKFINDLNSPIFYSSPGTDIVF